MWIREAYIYRNNKPYKKAIIPAIIGAIIAIGTTLYASKASKSQQKKALAVSESQNKQAYIDSTKDGIINLSLNRINDPSAPEFLTIYEKSVADTRISIADFLKFANSQVDAYKLRVGTLETVAEVEEENTQLEAQYQNLLSQISSADTQQASQAPVIMQESSGFNKMIMPLILGFGVIMFMTMRR